MPSKVDTVPILKPTIEDPRARPDIKGLEQLAWLMDRAFKIPGTNVTVGLDAILGLLPIGGDVLTGIVQAGIVLVAITRYRVPRPIAARMVANVLLDIGVGSIPIVGDVFDILFKANTKNLQLLERVRQQQTQALPVSSKPSIAYIAMIAFAFLVVLSLLVIGFITVVGWILKRPIS